MKTLLQLTTILFVLLVANSCKEEHFSATDLYQSWEVEGFVSGESSSYEKYKDNKLIVTFNEDQTYYLTLDVNDCGGAIQIINGHQIQLKQSGCTYVCCDSDFSQKLVEMLPQATSFKIVRNRLKLFVPGWGIIELKAL